LNRRAWLGGVLAAAGALATGDSAFAATGFERWVESFRAQAVRRGVSEATYNRVMSQVKPDTAVYALQRRQPEFTEEMWQYINRRCSDWRVITGKERAKEYASVLARVEREFGVDRYVLLGLWGMESSYGDVIDNPKYMRPIIPALAALAYGEPRRRRYWESELINALKIVDRGWAQPAGMIGSWAGAMGHTQWMPEVWLAMGVDFDRDGRINPFGKPDDALAGTARYLSERGKWRRGEAWGCEVKLPPGGQRYADNRTMRSYETWHGHGFRRADGEAFKRPGDQVKLWIPVADGPAFLVGQNFRAVYSYNPSSSYSLALVHLGDLVRGDGDFRQPFPGGERIPTIDEIKEIQRRLNQRGFQTDGIDGRTGSDTVRAIGAYQKSVGMKADGYAGLKVLERLRQP
jgi:lytic murein transglycosylase